MNETTPKTTSPESDAVAFSRQRLDGFEFYHSHQILTEIGRFTRTLETESFTLKNAATSKTTKDGRRVAHIAFQMPMIRISGVGDVLSRDWVIFSDGRINTCDTFLSSPDTLDVSTLAVPEPKDSISDKDKILDTLSKYPQKKAVQTSNTLPT